MKNRCRCCGRELVGDLCNYCGLEDVICLDKEADEQRKTQVIEYKTNLVESISSFYIKLFVYEIDAASEKVVKKRTREKMVIASGADCFKKVAWTENEIFQNTDETKKTRELVVFYDINGATKSFVTNIDTIATDIPWALGIEVDDALTATVYLGTKDSYTKSEKNNLEWI